MVELNPVREQMDLPALPAEEGTNERTVVNPSSKVQSGKEAEKEEARSDPHSVHHHRCAPGSRKGGPRGVKP